MKKKSVFKKLISFIINTIILISIVFISTNLYMIYTTKDKILDINELAKNDYETIIVLGAAAWGSNPSPLLEDRLIKGIELYDNNISQTILMSGDHREDDYNEVGVMKNYAVKKGVNENDIYLDDYGLSTYDSMYRTKEIFNYEKVVVVTQDYHLYRALYIGEKLGLNISGYSANIRNFRDQGWWNIREFLARTKDFFKVIIKPKSIYTTK